MLVAHPKLTNKVCISLLVQNLGAYVSFFGTLGYWLPDRKFLAAFCKVQQVLQRVVHERGVCPLDLAKNNIII